MRPVILSSLLLFSLGYGLQGQSIKKTAATRSTQEKNPASVPYDGTAKVSTVPQVRWLDLGYGKKFKSPDDPKLKQVIAINPYLTPEHPFFGEMLGLQSLPDGSLLLAGSGGFDAEGETRGTGWWKISPDGAIALWASRPLDRANPGVYPSNEFSITPDGSILTSTGEGAVVLISENGEIKKLASGLKKPGRPLLDPSGNIWVSVAEEGCNSGCKLIQITPQGQVKTIISAERTWNNPALAGPDRITLSHLVWDVKKGEIIAGGSSITAKPHGLHTSIWRINANGEAKRVFYSSKGGGAQSTDGINDLALDKEGRIVIATKMMQDRARRQIARLDEKSGKLTVLTGKSYRKNSGLTDYRPGHEEAPYDGAAANANIRQIKNLCVGPDGTLYFLDEHQLRRLDLDGVVRTWAY